MLEKEAIWTFMVAPSCWLWIYQEISLVPWYSAYDAGITWHCSMRRWWWWTIQLPPWRLRWICRCWSYCWSRFWRPEGIHAIKKFNFCTYLIWWSSSAEFFVYTFHWDQLVHKRNFPKMLLLCLSCLISKVRLRKEMWRLSRFRGLVPDGVYDCWEVLAQSSDHSWLSDCTKISNTLSVTLQSDEEIAL